MRAWPTLFLLFGSVALAQSAQPDQRGLSVHLDAARKARNEKRFSEAEREGRTALSAAEAFGPMSFQLNSALTELAFTYFTQGNYAAAEPLYLRATELGAAAGLQAAAVSWQFDYLGLTRQRQEKYEAAIAAFEKAVSYREQAPGAAQPDLPSILSDLSFAQKSAGKLAEAEASLQRALGLRNGLVGPDRARTANTLMSLAAVLDAEAKFPEEEAAYREALKIREALFGSADPSVADTLNALAELLRHRNRVAESEPLYRRALEIREKALGPEHRAVGSSANNLALAVENLGKPDEAEALFLRAIGIADHNSGSEGGQLPRYMCNLAVFYRGRGRLPEAEKLAAQALALREKITSPSNMEMVAELRALAGVFYDERRYADAEPLYRRAVTILEKNLSADHPDVSREMARLADTVTGLRRYPEAEELYQRALGIMRTRFGPDALQTAVSTEALARFYLRVFRYGDSGPLYLRAIAIREAKLPEEPERLALTQNNYAVFLRAEGKYREAVEVLEKAARGRRQSAAELETLGDLYDRLGYYSRAEALLLKAMDEGKSGDGSDASRLRRLALLYANQQRYAQAAPLLDQAIALARKSRDTEAENFAMEDLANVRRDARQFLEAGKLYNQVLLVRERDWPDSPYLAMLLDNMASSALRQGKFAEAEPPLLRAQRINQKFFSFPNAYGAACLGNFALLYRGQKRLAEAESAWRRSIAMWEQSAGADAPVLAPMLREFAQVRRLQGNETEAAALVARARKIAVSEPRPAPGAAAVRK